MFSLCHRHLSFWFSQESNGKGERFSSEGDACVPRPCTIQATPFAPECGRTFPFRVSSHDKPWCLWKVKHRSSRLEHHLIEVTPDPVLSRLEGLNERMGGGVEMPGGVLVL